MKLCAIQINSGSNKQENLTKVSEMVKEAASHGAKFISLPEVFNFRGTKEESIENTELITGKSIVLLQGLAQEYKVWILNGSFFERVEGEKLPYNSSVLISPDGTLAAVYRKMHLFDVELKDKVIKESEKSQAGKEPVIAQVDGFKLGMSICYDLRFPELYRLYSKEKVELISVPSAFTKVTGLEHWHCLLKARAIENQAYVIAANQCGEASGVETYGHSLIVDPWGRVLIEASENKEEIIYADMNLDYLYKLRREVPALDHRLL